VLLALLTLPWMPSVTHAQETQLVLAFYYAWYDENTWSTDKVPDMPLEPYRSADRTTIERHVRESKGAGIDALVQSWYGPGTNPTESNFRTLLDVAQAQGVQAGVDLEVTSPFMPTLDEMIAGLKYLIETHAQHPAYLRYKGKPVIFFWRQQQWSVEQWATIRKQVDPNHTTVWVAESDNPTWLDVFDALHLYSITWAVNTDPMYTATKMRKRVDEYVATHGVERYWIATTMPGYDDTHIEGRTNAYVYPRSPEYYSSTWDAAIASTPEMVIINSYNEWREGTMIEPSVTYGSTYLDLTRQMSALYKGSQAAQPGPTPTETAVPTEAATETPVPTETATLTPEPTATEIAAPTSTPEPTTTSTQTPLPTATPTALPTETLIPATETPVPTPTAFPSETPAPPAETSTVTPSYRPMETATPTTQAAARPARAGPPCLGGSLVPAGAVGLVMVWRKDRTRGVKS